MWHTPAGDRTLRGSEAKLLREVIGTITDELTEEAEGYRDEWPLGVRVYDELPWQQRLALLTRVARALFRDDVVTPELTAVNEGAIGAIFAYLRREVEIEIDQAKDFEGDKEFDAYYWRRLIAACQDPPESADDFVVDVECSDLDDWECVIESIEAGILWDGDWNMPDLFLDAEPKAGNVQRRLLGIDKDYYSAPAPDLRDSEVPGAFNTLRELTRDPK